MTVHRVLLSTDAVGGVWTYAIDLAGALSELDVEPIIAVMGPSPDEKRYAQAAGIHVFDTGLPLDWLAEDSHQIRNAGRALAQLAEDVGADVLQLHSAALACDVEFNRRVVAVQHSCVATWWAAVRGGPLPLDFLWRRETIEAGLNFVDAAVAPTTAFAAQIERVYSPSRRVYAVHNGRRAIPLPRRTNGDFVLTAGRLWDDGKNARTLDEAAEMIAVPFEAVGPTSGPNGSAVKIERMRTPGTLDESAIAQRLAARPIFASSAIYEPFGLAVLEAAQAGCALVLSDIPSFRELWAGAALFVQPEDANGFAVIINQLLRDRELRAQLGRAAQLKARAYTPEQNARRMLRIYEQVAPANTGHQALAGAA